MWCNPYHISELNQTNICLIPKVESLQTVNQFLLISLCNFIYKIMIKVVVEILKHIMDKLVSPFQTGFVLGRSIHENIIIAKEVMNILHKKRGKKGFFAIKLNLSKLYDKLDWEFI